MRQEKKEAGTVCFMISGLFFLLDRRGIRAFIFSMMNGFLLQNGFHPEVVSNLMGRAKEIITIEIYGDNKGIAVDSVCVNPEDL